MRAFLLASAVFLAACAGTFTPVQQAAIACRAYASTLTALVPFKHRMTDSQVESVDRANESVIPACRVAALEGGIEPDTLLQIRDKLRELLLLEQELQRGRPT